MFALARRGRHAVNVWPAFVDALASILLVLIFMVLVFVVGQFILSEHLALRERSLEELTRQVSALSQTLSLERARAADLQSRLAVTIEERDALGRQAAEQRSRVESLTSQAAAQRSQIDSLTAQAATQRSEIEALRERRAAMERELAALGERLEERRREASTERERSEAFASRVDLLNQQIAALREQIARLSAALELAESTVTRQQAEITRLGERLNLALARRVAELERYRSEFFGRLRSLLAEHPSIRIVGDRFVFQSELLFPSGEARLAPQGERRLRELASILKEVTAKIPDDLEWLLRVDGHTDRRPIRTAQFPSNWELSSARALSVVDFLIGQGLPARRLAAAGFGEFHPLDAGDSADAYARNRRIEIKLTQP